MKTVLVTGTSSGYGLKTALHFLAQGWNVIATMRTPREGLLPDSQRLRVLQLDVTRAESIAAALEAAGPIDVLVNNAGIGVVGAFEATPMATVREVFETNTFGVMAMTQAVIPLLRARRSGVIVNVTSSVTLARLCGVRLVTRLDNSGFPRGWTRSPWPRRGNRLPRSYPLRRAPTGAPPVLQHASFRPGALHGGCARAAHPPIRRRACRDPAEGILRECQGASQ